MEGRERDRAAFETPQQPDQRRAAWTPQRQHRELDGAQDIQEEIQDQAAAREEVEQDG